MSSRFAAAIEAAEVAVRRSAAFRAWLRMRRWCGESVGQHAELAVQDSAILSETGTEALVFLLAVSKEGGSSVLLNLPLSIATARFAPDAFELAVAPDRCYVLEAERRESYARFLVDGLRGSPKIRTRAGGQLLLKGERSGSFRTMGLPGSGDSSNLVFAVVTSEASLIFKSYKLLDPQNREPGILERLHRRRFPHAPALLGELSLSEGEDRLVLGVATKHIDATDLFTWLVGRWQDALRPESLAPEPFEAATLPLAAELAEATAALHEALVDRKPGPFQAESFTPEDAQSAYRLATRNLSDALRLLAHREPSDALIPPGRAADVRSLLLDHRRDIEDVLASVHASVGTVKSVTHADLHLGQVLLSPRGGALTFIDFEGEPERLPAARSMKLPPLRDVATMIRSFAYVRHTALHNVGPGASSEVAARLRSWEDAMVRTYRDRYLGRTTLYPELERETAERVIRGWTMEKALYELRYELKHRPANYAIPLDGVLSLAGVRP
jgi:trehalose synthase-fused probable maltokinase